MGEEGKVQKIITPVSWYKNMILQLEFPGINLRGSNSITFSLKKALTIKFSLCEDRNIHKVEAQWLRDQESWE